MNWRMTSSPRLVRAVPRVTTSAADAETISAGTWLTRPSPMVRRVNRSAVAESDQPYWTIPTYSPPSRLISVMTTAAIASPRRNFDAPSIAP